MSEFSDYPEAARSIPRVGGLEVSAERVASLHPDLVLASQDGNARGPVMALESAGIPVLAVSGGSLDAVIEGIRRVAARLGRGPQGESVAADLSRRTYRPGPPGVRRRPRGCCARLAGSSQGAGTRHFSRRRAGSRGRTTCWWQCGLAEVSAEFRTRKADGASSFGRARPRQSLTSAPLPRDLFRAGRSSRRRASLRPRSPRAATRPGARVFGVLSAGSNGSHR